jgi:phage minor structural protein
MTTKNIFVFDGQSEMLLTVLSVIDNDQCPFYETEVVEQLNKDFTFNFSVPADHEDSKHLVKGNLVGFHDLDNNLQVFQIFQTEEEHTGTELKKLISAEHLFYEMADDIVEDQRVVDGTATDALTKALSASRWTVGTVDPLGTGTVNFYYSNGIKNIQDTANEFGGELGFRLVLTGNTISQRLVDMKARRGSDTGKRFEFTKDLSSVKRTEQFDGLKTALYGRGKGEETENNGYSRKVTFKDIVWTKAGGDPVDKPAGQEWVGDPTALANYGRANATRHRFGTFDFETTDPRELLEKTWQELQRVSVPRVTYELSVIALEELTGYEHEKVRLGDTVYVIDRELGLTIEARVIEIKRDLLNPENTEIVLGNFIDDITTYNQKIDELEAVLTDRKGVWDSVEKIDPTVDDTNIENVTPSVPTNISAQGLFKSIILKWTFDPSIRISAYEVYGSKVNNFTPDSSNLLFKGKSGGYVHNANTNETWYFRIRAINPHGVASAFTQQFSATTIQIASPDYADLSIGNAKIADVSADKLTAGTIDANEIYVVNINADNINAGKLKAQYIQIGSTTTYEAGYDPSTKATPTDVSNAKSEAISTASQDATNKANQAEENAKTYVDNTLQNYVDISTYDIDMTNLQNQIDGNITTWFYSGEPTLTNAPAVDWTTNELKNQHLGDLYYDSVTGYAYRFMFTGTEYVWTQIQDNDVQKALQDASKAQDTADAKRRVFVSQPVPPYDVGDLWTQGISGDLMKCKVARASGSYVASDWEKAVKYTDDTRAVQAEDNAKNYAKPTVTAVYDVDFLHEKAFWSESYNGQTVSPTTAGTVKLSTEASRGGKVWEIAGQEWIYALNPIPVNVNRVYKVTFRVRQTVDKTTGGSNVYAGVATLDNNFVALTGGAGTHRYCAVSGATITVADGWQQFEGLITGTGDNHNQFRAGTAYVRPMFIVNYSGGNGTVEVDFIDFQDVTELNEIKETLSEVDLRTTESSIIATVRNSTSYKNDLDGKADTTALGNYASKDELTQAKSDMEQTMDTKIGQIDFTPYATKSEVEQTANALDFKFSSSGGVNLLKNSVGYAGTDFWTVTFNTGGSVDTIQNAELVEKGVGSGFVLKGAKLVQTIVNAPQYHTISTLVKKGTSGTGYIKVTYTDASGTRTDKIDFVSGTAYDYKKYEIIIQPVGNTITVELYGDVNSGIIFTGTMVNVGNVALQWQHSAGEIYNTNVLMDLNGIRVNSSSYNGYTTISPTEFAGYAEVPDASNNLVMTKVFTLNKDVTEVSKIDVDKEVTMAPVKVVPVTGTYNGWAFIAIT